MAGTTTSDSTEFYVDITDYGACGNGLVDNSDALTAADAVFRHTRLSATPHTLNITESRPQAYCFLVFLFSTFHVQ